MPTVLDAIKRLGCEYLGTSRLPSGVELVQLRYKKTRFSVTANTPYDLYEAVLERVAGYKCEDQGLPRTMAKAIVEATRQLKAERASAGKLEENADVPNL